MNLKNTLIQMTEKARKASIALASLSRDQKDKILEAMASALDAARLDIIAANQKDMQAGEEQALTDALLDRLYLDDDRIIDIVNAIREVKKLSDPVGGVMSQNTRENGLVIQKVRVPIGVIAVIYESRPNVTADVSTLCIKAGNAIILRGGSDAMHSNQAIAHALLKGGEQAGLPAHSIQLITSTDRDAVKELVQLTGKLDLVIPRGGEGLINAVIEYAKVPVIKHYKGLCATYVDATADLKKALAICENAKCQRPGVCNAMETLLVHEAVANEFLPQLSERLMAENVELRGDETAKHIVPRMTTATAQDWDTEYLDKILAIKVVNNVTEAIEHINHHGSHHSDAILTNDTDAKNQFLNQVDSAAVYVNASTRFTDGGEFGMGAEIGISTDKLHARGPMGLPELTTYKYHVLGDGQIRV